MTAERAEIQTAASRFGNVQVDATAERIDVNRLVWLPRLRPNRHFAAECVHLYRSGHIVQMKVGGETVDVVRALDAFDIDRAAENSYVEVGAPGHLDVEVCSHDVVARPKPARLALTRVHEHRRPFGVYIELDAIQAAARRGSNRIDDDLGPVAGR